MPLFRQATQTAAGESIGFGLGKTAYEMETLVVLTENKPIVETQGNTLWLLLLNTSLHLC